MFGDTDIGREIPLYTLHMVTKVIWGGTSVARNHDVTWWVPSRRWVLSFWKAFGTLPHKNLIKKVLDEQPDRKGAKGLDPEVGGYGASVGDLELGPQGVGGSVPVPTNSSSAALLNHDGAAFRSC